MLDERDGRGRDRRDLEAMSPEAMSPEAVGPSTISPDAISAGNGQQTGAGAREAAPGRGPTVMIVDDDDAIREALEDVLSDEGYRIVGMSDGQQALEHLNSEARPDALSARLSSDFSPVPISL